MTDNRKSGIALIAGAIGGIITMAIHPTAGAAMTPAQVDRLAIVSGIAHGRAILSVVVLFLGSCGLAKGVAAADRVFRSRKIQTSFGSLRTTTGSHSFRD